ncbi:MAG TPA: L,D-transpeptidase [Pyrinomonadaceae bacterium]|nr:L,D-transpeptidase [Pyrinomonadaceae bacterium]
MKRVLRWPSAALALSLVFAASACTNEPTGTTGTNATTNTTTNTTATPAATPAADTAAAGGANMPVTLPVLDALFADERFAGELKSRLQLTDEQVERLRAVAREETSSLREGEGDAHGGRTSEATARAEERVRSVVGDEKARQLMSFVRERWSTGGESGEAAALMASKPNAVPTDTRIVVNAPAYRMDVFEGGRLVKSYRIGIGYPEFPLPTGMRRATSIIFNPTWTPPDEPWVEAPSSKVKVGETVPAGSKLNPLGPIKIPIGLPSLIHGGKSPARLGTFASHGCVGLTDKQVQEFAPVIARLGGADVTAEDVTNYAKQKTETKNVKLERPVPVELRYETIVVENGKLYIYRDVYDHGTNTEQNLRAVLQAHGVSFDQLSEPERAQVMQALQEMARDAQGNPADGQPTPTPAADNKNKNKNANAGGERVTRNVKGRKEIVLEIAALQGKGYPAPVDLNTGGAPQQQQKPAAKRAKRS